MELQRFNVVLDSEEEYFAHLERLRWPDGIACIYCTYARVARTWANSGQERSEKGDDWKPSQSALRTVFQCGNRDCRRQFSITSGTLFHKTHVPLSKWYRAITAICASPVTSKALQIQLDVSYQTAWYLRKRIREALRSGENFVPGFLNEHRD